MQYFVQLWMHLHSPLQLDECMGERLEQIPCYDELTERLVGLHDDLTDRFGGAGLVDACTCSDDNCSPSLSSSDHSSTGMLHFAILSKGGSSDPVPAEAVVTPPSRAFQPSDARSITPDASFRKG